MRGREERQPPDAAVGAEEVLHEGVRGVGEQFGGRRELGEMAAGAHHGDHGAELDGLVDVVGDEDDRLAQLRLDPQEFVLQALADDRVDGRERLVHQQHRRVRGERPRHADALLLSAGQLVGVALGEGGVEPDPLHQLPGPRPRLVLPPAEHAGHGGDVVDDRAVLEESGVLDDVTHGPAQRVDRLLHDVDTVEGDGPLARLHHPVDHAQGRRLPAARGADEDGDRAVGYLQGEPVDRHRAVRVPLGD